MNKKNIILIGMMGCGKTTVARLLDQKLDGFLYVDLDKEIEKEVKKTIVEIFSEIGEEGFRDLESKVLKKFCAYSHQVIATGGGSVERVENLEEMKKNGLVFYLKARPEALYERIKMSVNRPMLFGDNPLQKLKDLMKKRESFYSQAHFEIETEKKELAQIVDEIAGKIKE